VRAYLVDRLVTKAWTLRQVQDELGAAPATLRHLLDRYQVRRVASTLRRAPRPQPPAGPPAKCTRSSGAVRRAWTSSLGD
jgi:hypothetical protein